MQLVLIQLYILKKDDVPKSGEKLCKNAQKQKIKLYT